MDNKPYFEFYEAKNAKFFFSENFFIEEEANKYFDIIQKETPWRQDKITIGGIERNIPRLQQWYGDGKYIYSGIVMEPLPWTDSLLEIKSKIEKEFEMLDFDFNSVLINLYRNGDDAVGWHSDSEPELGKDPVIASISLGASREFILRRNDDHKEKISFDLTNGSLLLMGGRTQHYWKHTLPARKKIKEPRINLTFRKIYEK